MNPSHQAHMIDIDGGTTPTNGDVRKTWLPANPFTIEPKTLTDMITEKNFESLTDHGGVKSLALTLRTDETNGISSNVTEMSDRKRVFGSNVYPKPPNKDFLSFAIEAARGVTIIQLLVLAVFSIGLGIMQQGPSKGWYDGLNILIATILVALISTVSNFSQSRQMEELSNKNSHVQTQVLRDGLRQTVSIFDIVVGDIVCLKIGDQIPADGLFLNGYSLEVEESSISTEENPFLFSGAQVADGYGRMMVTSVGMNTRWGQMMSSMTLTLKFFLTAVTMAAGAKFECLHPALILTLTSSMRRMIMDKCTIVRNPSTFEKLASVTILCTDKTGTLTSNEMSVAEFCVGKEMVTGCGCGSLAVNNQVQELIYQAVGLNTTGSVFQGTSESTSTPQISASPSQRLWRCIHLPNLWDFVSNWVCLISLFIFLEPLKLVLDE